MAEMKVLSHEADSLRGNRRRSVDGLKRQYLDLMAETLADLDAGEAAAVPLRVRALTLFGMMNWIYTWYDPNGPVAPPGGAARPVALPPSKTTLWTSLAWCS